MSITVSWDDHNPSIMKISYSSHWTWVDIQLAEQIGTALIEARSYEQVIVIHNMWMSNSLPPNTIVQIKTLIQKLHPRICLMIFVGINSSLKSIAKQLAYQNFQGEHKFAFVSTYDKALQQATQFLQDMSVSNENL